MNVASTPSTITNARVPKLTRRVHRVLSEERHMPANVHHPSDPHRLPSDESLRQIVGPLVPVASVRQIMQGIVDPATALVFNSVQRAA